MGERKEKRLQRNYSLLFLLGGDRIDLKMPLLCYLLGENGCLIGGC